MLNKLKERIEKLKKCEYNICEYCEKQPESFGDCNNCWLDELYDKIIQLAE